MMCTPLSVSTMSLSSPTFNAKLHDHKADVVSHDTLHMPAATAAHATHAPGILERLLHHTTRERPEVTPVAGAAAVALGTRNILELRLAVDDLLAESCDTCMQRTW